MELSGPMERAVIQRGKDGLADIPVAGTVEAPDGTEVLGRILPPATAEAGIEWVRFGSVKGGQFTGVLKGAATGGPYRVQVKCGKKMLTVRDILVGDLYVLAGQSNMDGCGKLVDCEPSSRPRTRFTGWWPEREGRRPRGMTGISAHSAPGWGCASARRSTSVPGCRWAC